MAGFDPLVFARANIKYHTDRDWPTEFGKVNYVLRGNGLWEVRKNSIGTFYLHLYEGKIGGFAEEPPRESNIELALPKIPRRIFNQIAAFFKSLTKSHDFEAYVQVIWDKTKQEFDVVCPPQVVSHGRVKYESTNVDPQHVIVCDIHSHNSMSAFFSTVDDRDEKQRGDRFFGVMGKLNTMSPEFKLSFILGGGERVYVDMGVLFEEESFPKEWLDKISYADRMPNKELAQKFDDFELRSDSDEEEIDDELAEAFDNADTDEDDEELAEPNLLDDIEDHDEDVNSFIERGFGHSGKKKFKSAMDEEFYRQNEFASMSRGESWGNSSPRRK